MTTRCLLSVILCSFCIPSFAQLDSLVRFNELTFSSSFERDVFTDFKQGNSEIFSLLIANGRLLGESKLKETRSSFYDYISTLNVDEKKREKTVKGIYDNLHKRYLIKYELTSRFEQIFAGGSSNSTSATAIFALVFDQLKIPYAIKQEPGQIYLIAYPANEKVIVRNYSEMGGSFVLNEEFKTSFVKRMKEQKLISESEYASSSISEMFDKYYFDQIDLSLTQVAAQQYVNDGLYRLAERRFDVSFALLEKGYYLAPNDRTGFVMSSVGIQAFQAHKENDSTHAMMLSKLSRYRNYGIDADMIEGELAKVSNKLLFEEGKHEKYQMYYRVLTRDMEFVPLRDRLAYFYHYEYGRYYYNQRRFKEALPHLVKTMELKPTDVNAQNLLIGCYTSMAQNRSEAEVLAKMESYGSQFPAIQENNNYNLIIAAVHLSKFFQSYIAGKPLEGDKSKALFEALAEKHDFAMNTYLISQAYSEAATYHFRKGAKVKARQYIDAGLKYAPNDMELLSRKQMIR